MLAWGWCELQEMLTFSVVDEADPTRVMLQPPVALVRCAPPPEGVVQRFVRDGSRVGCCRLRTRLEPLQAAERMSLLTCRAPGGMSTLVHTR